MKKMPKISHKEKRCDDLKYFIINIFICLAKTLRLFPTWMKAPFADLEHFRIYLSLLWAINVKRKRTESFEEDFLYVPSSLSSC